MGWFSARYVLAGLAGLNPVHFLANPVDCGSLSAKVTFLAGPFPVDLISNPVEYFETIHAELVFFVRVGVFWG